MIGLIVLLSFYCFCWGNRNNDPYAKAVFDMLLITSVTSFFFDAYNKKIFWIPILLCMISLTRVKSNGRLGN